MYLTFKLDSKIRNQGTYKPGSSQNALRVLLVPQPAKVEQRGRRWTEVEGGGGKGRGAERR
jgi:hypothetical protein